MAEIRLSKLTRQFNIGLGTLIEFLNEKGAGISSNDPNFKVSDEFLPVLQAKFGGDQAMKQDSEKVATKLKEMIDNLREGVMSLRQVSHKGLFTFYTLAIWLSYFLHYWITFQCFNFTEHLGFTAAIVSFIVGSISVIVPTPNGAGPWHLAVKTILVLYGVTSTDAVAFALIVHTIQTALVPVLGMFSIFALATKTPCKTGD